MVSTKWENTTPCFRTNPARHKMMVYAGHVPTHFMPEISRGILHNFRLMLSTTFLPTSITRIEQHLLCTLVSISLEVHLFQVAFTGGSSERSFPTEGRDINVASMHSDGGTQVQESESQWQISRKNLATTPGSLEQWFETSTTLKPIKFYQTWQQKGNPSTPKFNKTQVPMASITRDQVQGPLWNHPRELSSWGYGNCWWAYTSESSPFFLAKRHKKIRGLSSAQTNRW